MVPLSLNTCLLETTDQGLVYKMGPQVALLGTQEPAWTVDSRGLWVSQNQAGGLGLLWANWGHLHGCQG